MVTVYATGGTGDLTFTLGTTEYVDEEGEGHYQFTGLKAGTLQTYTVTVTDENNCSITNDQIKVPEPPELTFDTLSHRLVCEADGIIDVLNINGGTNKENSTGYTVRWDAQGGKEAAVPLISLLVTSVVMIITFRISRFHKSMTSQSSITMVVMPPSRM
jgi:hypothetical protein